MSRLQVHEATRSIAQCILSDLVKSEVSIKNELQAMFPAAFEIVNEKTKISKWRDEYVRLKRIGVRSITYPMELQYKSAMNDLIRVIGDKFIDDVTVADIDDYVEIRSGDDSVISPRTLVNKFALLKTCFSYAEKKGVIQKCVLNSATKPECHSNPTLPPPFDLVDELCDMRKSDGSRLTDETWRVLPFCFRYTGCRLDEICGMRTESICVEEGIPCMRVEAGKAELRKYNRFPGGIKTIPAHPRLWPLLCEIKTLRSGLLFPDAGIRNIGDKDRPDIRYGYIFSKEFNIAARKIWSKMHVHAWRSYVCSYLTKVAMVPEIVSEDIAGHAGGTVHREYAGLAPLRIRYEAVCKLP